ncbi:MAG: 16S rRNA processing protein RimM [Ignavibacteria bacterium]|nr:16S rRNA processing protein RimM [Ignavibacteria bacterium]
MLPAQKPSDPTSDNSDSSEFTEYLGVIARPIGIDGSMLLTDAVPVPVALLRGAVVGVGASRQYAKQYVVECYESNPLRPILRLSGISTPEQVRLIADLAVFVSPSDLRPSAQERYAVGDIEGCRVFLDNGTPVGTVREVMLLPANDVWVVETPEGKRIPLPVIDDVVKNVDIPNHAIVVRLLPGLEDVYEDTH